VPEVVEFTKRCEDAGFDGVGFVDSQMITRDAVVMLAAAATATHRVRLVPAVTNPITRHVSVWASTAQALDELAPGRIEIWMGRGASSVNLAGMPYATVRRLRETVTNMRRLMAGEWDVFPDVHTRMGGSGRQVPIRIAAAGPQALKLAGAIGDSVLIAAGGNDASLQRARDLVHEGARAAGRDPAEVQISLSLMTSIREQREDAYRWASPLCARNLRNAAWLADAGIDARGMQSPPELDTLYPDFFHAEDWNRAMALSSFLPDDLLAQMAPRVGLVGSPEDCVERLRELSRAGFTEVFMQTIGTMNYPEAELRAFATTIGPAVAALP